MVMISDELLTTIVKRVRYTEAIVNKVFKIRKYINYS